MNFLQKLDEALGTYNQKRKSGSMIAAYPDNKSREKIAKYQKSLKLPKTSELIPPERFHITIRYWPEHDELEDKVIEWLEENNFPQLELEPTKTEILGDDKCLVIRFNSKTLSDIYNKVNTSIQDLGLPPSDYAIFKPHLSIAINAEKPTPIDLGSIKIDHWKLINRDEEIAWEHSSDTNEDE
jgi:2'-5' RNA ligase